MLRRLLSSAHSDARSINSVESSSRKTMVNSLSTSSLESEIINRSDIPTSLKRSKSFTHRNEAGGDFLTEIDFNSTEMSIDPFDTVSTLKRSKSMLFLTDRTSFVDGIKKTVKSVRFSSEVSDSLPKINEEDDRNETISSNYDLINDLDNPNGPNGPITYELNSINSLFKPLAEYKLYNNSFQKAFEVTDSFNGDDLEQENFSEKVSNDMLQDDPLWFEKVSDSNNRLKLNKLKLSFNDLANSKDNHFPDIENKTRDILGDLNSPDIISPASIIYGDGNLINSGKTSITSGPESYEEDDDYNESDEDSYFPFPNSDLSRSVKTNVLPSSADSLNEANVQSILKVVNVDNDTVNSEKSEIDGNYASNEALIDSLLKGLTSFDSLDDLSDKRQHLVSLLMETINNLDLPVNLLLGKLSDSLEAISKQSQVLKLSLENKFLEISQLNNQLSELNSTIGRLTNQKELETVNFTQQLNSLQENEIIMKLKIENNEHELQKLLYSNNELNNLNHKLKSDVLSKVLKEEINDKFITTISKLLFDESELQYQEATGNTNNITQALKKLINEKVELDNDLLDLLNEKDDLTHKLSTLETIVKNLEPELINMKEKYEELQIVHNMNQTNHELVIESLNLQIKNLKMKLNDLNDIILKKDQDINRLETENYDQRAANIQLEQANMDLHDIKSKLKKDQDEKDLEIKQLQKSNTELQNKASKFENLYNDTISKCSLLELLSSQNEKTIIELESQNANLTEEIHEKSDLIVNLTFENGELHKLVNTITQEKFEIISNNNYYITKYNQQKDCIEEIQGKLDECTTQMNGIINNNKMLKESHGMVIKYYHDLLYSCKQSLKPMMYNESVSYFESILKPFQEIGSFLQSHNSILTELNVFIVKAINDLVFNYMENETILEKEFLNKQNEYTKMLNELSSIMIKKLNLSENCNQNLKELLHASKELPNYLNETYRSRKSSK